MYLTIRIHGGVGAWQKDCAKMEIRKLAKGALFKGHHQTA
jgi:hypothetical protein